MSQFSPTHSRAHSRRVRSSKFWRTIRTSRPGGAPPRRVAAPRRALCRSRVRSSARASAPPSGAITEKNEGRCPYQAEQLSWHSFADSHIIRYLKNIVVLAMLLATVLVFRPGSFLIRGAVGVLIMLAVCALATRWIKVSLHMAFGALATTTLLSLLAVIACALVLPGCDSDSSGVAPGEVGPNGAS